MDSSVSSISRQALWERKLLDFSLRNNLLNTKLGKRCLPFVSFDLHLLEDNIQKGKDYTIVAFKDKKIDAYEDGMYHSEKQAESYKQIVSEYIQKNKILSFLSETELTSNLKYLFRTSRTAMEENGANCLFLSLGMLKWYENEKKEQPRFAPLLLIPVNLIRKGGNSGYVLRLRDEDVMFNITLTEFLRQQFKINLDFLSPLPSDESGVDIQAVFDGVSKAIEHCQGWEILQEATLGLFYFNKFVMWNDIHSNTEDFLKNPIIKSLTENRILWQQNGSDSDTNSQNTDNIAFEDTAMPMDYDSSQMKAVIEAEKCRSFVLHGPPGTGKSQTITNIIANALFHGKRVLFVAEKMAALSVVQKRLEKIGVGDFCLELHSNKATKTHFLSQMQKALDVVHIKEPQEYKHLAEELNNRRKEIASYTKTLHTQIEKDDYTLQECIEGYLSANCEELEVNSFERINTFAVEKLRKEISNMSVAMNICSHPALHPLKGLLFKDNRTETLNVLKSLLNDFKIQTDTIQLFKQSFNLTKYIDTDALSSNDYIEWINAVKELQFEEDKVKEKFVLLRPFAKHSYNNKLKQTAESYKQTLSGLQTMSKCWLEAFDKINEWYQWLQIKNRLNDSSDTEGKDIKDIYQGLYSDFFKFIYNNDVTPEDAFNGWLKGLYKAKIIKTVNSNDELRCFNGLMFSEVIAKYRRDNAVFQQLTREELYYKLASAVPSQTIQAMASSEMGILKRNIMNGGRGMSVRSIIDSIPNLIGQLAPCMLMSPISVAQYLDIKNTEFDLVIFDEASQMPTSEAIGSIARSRALIVVGDPMQMPPTNFFSASQTDDEEAQADDLESILDDCMALSMPSYYLQWHYRSKHESLIAFSNTQYYGNRLFTFPSTDDRLAKVKLIQIEGVYDKGKSRSNIYEAKAIVDEVIRRLSDNNLSKLSIGIVSFSKAQQDLIEDCLTEELGKFPELEQRAYNCEEPIFIKNLENVQGDERDVILFSVGYGPDKDGKISMNFGPLNNNGGERRLNVAVSRSRYEMIVYSTLRPEQIDLTRSSSKGVEGLKRFLEFAKSNNQTVLSQSESSDNHKNVEKTSYNIFEHTDYRNKIIDDLSDILNSKGYKTVKNIGRSGFKIDLAVCDKQNENRYIMAVLHDKHCTGTVSDREIVQTGALERLSWTVFKLWTMDWYTNKDAVIDRILQRLESIETQLESTDNPTDDTESSYTFSIQNLKEDKTLLNKQNKELNKFQQLSAEKKDIERIPTKTIEEAVIFALKQQIAIPEDDLKRIVAKMLGFSRMGTKIDTTIHSVILTLQSLNIIKQENNKIILSDNK